MPEVRVWRGLRRVVIAWILDCVNEGILDGG